MPVPKDAERIRRAEKEIGENIPEEMKGLDTEDLGDVGAERERERERASESE